MFVASLRPANVIIQYQMRAIIAGVLHRCGCVAVALRFCRVHGSAMCFARQRRITFPAAPRKSSTTIMRALSMCGWTNGASSSTASIQVPSLDGIATVST